MLWLITIVIVLIVLGVARSTIRSSRDSEAASLERLTRVLKEFRFPLTPMVLDNMNALSSAEFAVTDADGRILTKTKNCPEFSVLTSYPQSKERFAMEQPDLEGFYHRVVNQFQEQDRSGQNANVHVFFPRKNFLLVLWEASRSPLMIGLLVLPIALAISYALANQVTRPLAELRKQVREIAEGNLQPIPESAASDEIRGLGEAINQMASQLNDRQEQLKQNERLTTLVQIGNSTAHHLRNSATGCRMAIDLLASHDDNVSESENYRVAKRQLELIESYIQKLMSISKFEEAAESGSVHAVDPAELLDEVLFLLSPTAEHLRVNLKVSTESNSMVSMRREDVQQLMINLIGNAIYAASKDLPQEKMGAVDISLNCSERQMRFSVTDSGAGPPEQIAEQIFQPFVTSRKEGTGLGLFVVKEIADRSGAKIDWTRVGERTEFVFELNRVGS